MSSKTKELIRYFLVCIATTLTSYGVRIVVSHLIWLGQTLSFWQGTLTGFVGWFIAVQVSWAGCRWYVYHSKGPVLKELGLYMSGRLGTAFLESFLLGFFTGICQMGVLLASVCTSVPVTIINYIMSTRIMSGRKKTHAAERRDEALK